MNYQNVELYNTVELLAPDNGVGKYMTRLPDELRKTLNPAALGNALCSAGSEVRFNVEGKSATVTLSSDGLGMAEVFQGNFHVSWQMIGPQPTEFKVSLPENIDFLEKVSKEKGLPFDPRLTRIILPIYTPIRFISAEGETSVPKKSQTPKTKYLTYGSSITHGASALRPTGSYAMRTAQRLGVDLVDLGFGGGAYCESQIADYMADRRDWDFASLELGINMVGGFSTEEFTERVNYLIERIAKAYADKWVFAIDIFTYADDYNPAAKKQNEFRRAVRNAVRRLDMPNLVHVDGRKILKDTSGLTFDLVHPAAAGMEEMASNLSSLIRKRMGKELS